MNKYVRIYSATENEMTGATMLALTMKSLSSKVTARAVEVAVPSK
jgi:hypothetical protein